MAISLDRAKLLKPGETLILNDGYTKPTRWRVNGKIKLWKRTPERFKVPLKYGLYVYGYLDELNAHLFTLESEL